MERLPRRINIPRVLRSWVGDILQSEIFRLFEQFGREEASNGLDKPKNTVILQL
jgi:hypothetical protein